MASGKSLELAKIPRRTPYIDTPRRGGIFDGPRQQPPRTSEEMAAMRRWVRVRDRLRSTKAGIEWARAHGFDELGRPL